MKEKGEMRSLPPHTSLTIKYGQFNVRQVLLSAREFLRGSAPSHYLNHDPVGVDC